MKGLPVVLPSLARILFVGINPGLGSAARSESNPSWWRSSASPYFGPCSRVRPVVDPGLEEETLGPARVFVLRGCDFPLTGRQWNRDDAIRVGRLTLERLRDLGAQRSRNSN